MKLINENKTFSVFISHHKSEKRKLIYILWLTASLVGIPAIIILIGIILFFLEDYIYTLTKLSETIEMPAIFTYKMLHNSGVEFSGNIFALSFFLPYCIIGLIIGCLTIICLIMTEKKRN